MPRREQTPPAVSAETILLEAQIKAYFANMQTIYNAAQSAESMESISNFLAKSANINVIREEYIQLVKELNIARIRDEPTYLPNFQSLIAFEELFSSVKYKIDVCSPSAPSVSSPVKRLIDPQAGMAPKSRIKLPPITLPKFNGDSKLWTVFYECYNTTIHNNKDLSNSEKLHYLIGQLSDSALTSVAGIDRTGYNYDLIYSTLVDKYQDVRALGTAYLDLVFNFKPLQSSQNLNSFLDVCATSIAAFEKLDIENKSDFIYLYIALKKVDKDTARLYENFMRSDKVLTFDNFIKFIKEQAKINERIPGASTYAPTQTYSKKRNLPVPKNVIHSEVTKSFVTATDLRKKVCPACNKDEHRQFYRCSHFLTLTPQERYNIVKASRGCVACLSFIHTVSNCNSKGNCRNCASKSHHTLLCFSSNGEKVMKGDKNNLNASTTPTDTGERASCSTEPVSLCSLNCKDKNPTTVLLATARVHALNKGGKRYAVKCLIDNASQHNYITSDCAKRLGLKVEPLSYPMNVIGFGNAASTIRGKTYLEIVSRFNNKSYSLNPLIVEKIIDCLPTSPVDKSLLTYLNSVPLADDTYHIPSGVDILLGTQMFTQILLSGHVTSPPGMPHALQTTLGFILMGDAPSNNSYCNTQTQTLCAITHERLDKSLRSFFELEEIPSSKECTLSLEEQECEDIYVNTTKRDIQGRYIVALPFKSDPSVLGNSSLNAEKRFNYLERKLKRTPSLQHAYSNIIKEYLERDYLAPVTQTDANLQYIIPYHFVQRDDKITTKVRLVLDASSPSAPADISLNQLLHKGHNLQSDIFIVLLNFRLFKIAICADIKQMYLQLKVHPEFWKFQRIFYRQCETDRLELLEFKRVCFGLSSSPFLALRTLKQLAADEGINYPLAAAVIKEGQFYMDDVICSTHTVDDALNLAKQLQEMFSAGCFELLKWSSNSSQFLMNYSKELLHPSIWNAKTMDFGTEVGQRVLGVKWEPNGDFFSFEYAPRQLKCTKRNMLSVIAQLFDILGFVAPVILYAKLLIKELWLLKIDWDDQPPIEITRSWYKFQNELHSLSQLRIPRHIGVSQDCEVTLVAFADASEKAYGAVLYSHIKTPEKIVVTLLCAKSKVAPIKTVSLARLELCAAHLLSKLVRTVSTQYNSRIKISRIFAFSDSTVTLNWINSSPHKLKTFVANRVAKIQTNLSPEHFYHVSGRENPSDCLSRGLTPAQLAAHHLWFSGPAWMGTECAAWPIEKFVSNSNNLPELKTVALTTSIPEKPLIQTIAERSSRWSKLLRIFAYILRFCKLLKTEGSITVDDLSASESFIIRAIQRVYFSDYINALTKNAPLPRFLSKLRPVVVDRILRVGGRLSASKDVSFDHKHPILLPNKDHIVDLIIDHVHRLSCHAGPQLTLSLIRKQYWILSARKSVRARIHGCVRCFKVRPKPYQTPVMADLPSCRLNISKPFAHTGIDYCGPFYITLTRGRGRKSQKAYICVFICLTTRAVHVEVAPDLTTQSFLNCFKRFLSRRGPVNRVWTDNGGCFQGAKAYFNEIFEFLNASYEEEFKGELAKNRIEWTMIPPNAPHFGGSWESTVKSFKSHLFRVIGSQILTYEELLTVLCQIEAILNSRPLGCLSEDPAEPLPLTPAHFLNTTPLNALPAVEVINERTNLLSRFTLLDQLVQSYWKRWRDEYLHTLQVREKWNTESRPVELGTIVLIMQDSAPLHWPLGTIEEIYPGPDGRIRVVLVKTKNGTLKRPVVRLCPLPINI